MIDLSNIRYRVVVMDEEGNQYNIKDFIQSLGWEENEKEISTRSSFTVRNDKTSKGYLSDIIKPGCLVGIFASDGASFDEEVARGYVEEWNSVEESSQNAMMNCINCRRVRIIGITLLEPEQSRQFRVFLMIGACPREITEGPTHLMGKQHTKTVIYRIFCWSYWTTR